MDKFLNTLYENIQWIFSEIGVTLLGLLVGKKASTTIKNKQASKAGGTNIAAGTDILSDNIQTQTTGNNSTSIQINGDYTSGITYQDALDIALDVFRANSQTFTNEAIKTIDERASDISNDLFRIIYTEMPDTINKLVEPAVQEAILNLQKAYAKNDSDVLKAQLLNLMKQRLKAQETNIEQIVLDEALTVIPKLNNKHMDVLSLHFSILQLKRTNINNRTNFINMIETEVLPFFFDEFATDSIYAHLQYTGCTTILSQGSTYKHPAELYTTNYIGLFNKGFTKKEFDEFMECDTNNLQQIITQCQLYPSKYQLNAMTLDTLISSIEEYHLDDYKEKLIQFYNQTSMSQQEIIKNLNQLFPIFERFDDLWNNTRSFKAMSLTSVGLAIAILNFNLKTGQNISLKDYLE